MDGVFLIDKGAGMSSFDVLRELKKKFSEPKMGHLGTLDPMATGLLVVFLGKATKLIPYFSELEKEYVAELELGKTSDTFDSTGAVKDTKGWKDSKGISEEDFQEVMRSFIGPQWQIQPSFSAIHFQGRRAYELAREGKPVDLGKRQVTIDSIQSLRYEFPIAELNLVCSSGTYIRSTIHELGEKLQTGAIMTALRRTRVGRFQIDRAKTLSVLALEDMISPVELVENYLERSRLAGNEYDYLWRRCQSLLNK